jgi:tetratricopeptide (TPR) repeat protein
MSYLQVKLGESKERSQAVDNRFDEAEACYKKAIDLNPKCLEAYHRLGYLNLSEGYTETADELFDEGLRHATGHSLIVAELWYGKVRRPPGHRTSQLHARTQVVYVDGDDT